MTGEGDAAFLQEQKANTVTTSNDVNRLMIRTGFILVNEHCGFNAAKLSKFPLNEGHQLSMNRV